MNTRFARVVEKAQPFCCDEDTEAINPVLFASDVIKLFQREHAAVVRKVKAMHVSSEDTEPMFDCGYYKACSDLLAWLDERGR